MPAAVGELVVVRDVADPSFDGAFTVTQVNSNSEFVYSQIAADATSGGGTVSLPPSCGQVDSNSGAWALSSGTPPLQITPPSQTGVASGAAYNGVFTATGGSGNGYSWCVLSGTQCDPNQLSPAALPRGFTLSSEGSCGNLCTNVTLTSTGTPAATQGIYPFTVQVTDSDGKAKGINFTLEIGCPVNLTVTPGGQYGEPFIVAQLIVAPNPGPPGTPATTPLQAYAQTCGFANGFNGQQEITSFPAYIAGQGNVVPNYPSNLSNNVYPSLCSGSSVENADGTVNQNAWNQYLCTLIAGRQQLPGSTSISDVPPLADPPNGSYTYFDPPYNPFPFYYPVGSMQLQPGATCIPKVQFTNFPLSCDNFPRTNVPLPYVVSQDGTTLSFVDAPANPKASGVLNQQPWIAFSTSLVGVDSQNHPHTLRVWTWNSTFKGSVTSGGSGGVTLTSQTASAYLPVPGSGTGGVTVTSIDGIPTPIVTMTLSQTNITWAQGLTATVQVNGASGGATATGSVTVNGGGYSSGPTTLDGSGSASLTIPPGSLALGSDALTVAYTPDNASASTYSQAWGSATLTVNPAVPQIVFAPIPGSQTYGTPITAGSLDAIEEYNGNPVSGTFVYTTGQCGGGGLVLTPGATILQVGSYSITACFTPSKAQFAATSATAPYSVTPASQSISFAPIAAQLVGATTSLSATATSGLPVAFQTLTPTVCSVSQTTATMLTLGTCTIEAMQSGGVDYNAANPVEVTFLVMGFTLTAEPSSETVKRGVLGVFLLKVTSVNGFAGSVSISCAGGPPNSVCGNFPKTVNVKANGTALALSGILFRPKDAAGTYTIVFTGISGTDTNTATAKFTVK